MNESEAASGENNESLPGDSTSHDLESDLRAMVDAQPSYQDDELPESPNSETKPTSQTLVQEKNDGDQEIQDQEKYAAQQKAWEIKVGIKDDLERSLSGLVDIKTEDLNRTMDNLNARINILYTSMQSDGEWRQSPDQTRLFTSKLDMLDQKLKFMRPQINRDNRKTQEGHESAIDDAKASLETAIESTDKQTMDSARAKLESAVIDLGRYADSGSLIRDETRMDIVNDIHELKNLIGGVSGFAVSTLNEMIRDLENTTDTRNRTVQSMSGGSNMPSRKDIVYTGINQIQDLLDRVR